MGLVIDSSALADTSPDGFYIVADSAWEVRLGADGSLEWIDRTAGGEVIHAVEPGTSAMRRAWIRTLAILPIDELLSQRPTAAATLRRGGQQGVPDLI